MKVTVHSWPRPIGERRVEIDTDRREVHVSFYVPRLGRPPVCEHATRIKEDELDDHIAKLTEAREQLRALPRPARSA